MKIDQKPQLIFQLTPKYPSSINDRDIEGVAHLSYMINPEGEVEQVHCLETTDLALAKCAIDAIKHSKWSPAKRQGKPTYCVIKQTVHFSSNEKAIA